MRTDIQPLDYASARSRRSRAWVVLTIARYWAVTPLALGVAATVGYWITRYELFALFAVGAGIANISGWAVIPGLAVTAGMLGKRESMHISTVDRHLSASLLITLLTPAVGFVCFTITLLVFGL